MGDSITAGYGVRSSFSFPSVYGDFLRRHNSELSVYNLGVNGLTTQGLLELLLYDRRLRQLVSQASLITITIGSNDLLQLLRDSNSHHMVNPSKLPMIFANMSKNLDQAGTVIRRLNPMATVKVATLYNPLSAGPYAQFNGQVQGAIDTANAIIITWAKRYGFVVVDLDREVRGKGRSIIGPDYGHPNAAGYWVIAKAFALK